MKVKYLTEDEQKQYFYLSALSEFREALANGDVNEIALAQAVLHNTEIYIKKQMVHIKEACELLGYTDTRSLREIAQKHGPDGTGKVRCEKRKNKWFFYPGDITAMIETGELRGPHGKRGE